MEQVLEQLTQKVNTFLSKDKKSRYYRAYCCIDRLYNYQCMFKKFGGKGASV